MDMDQALYYLDNVLRSFHYEKKYGNYKKGSPEVSLLEAIDTIYPYAQKAYAKECADALLAPSAENKEGDDAIQ